MLFDAIVFISLFDTFVTREEQSRQTFEISLFCFIFHNIVYSIVKTEAIEFYSGFNWTYPFDLVPLSIYNRHLVSKPCLLVNDIHFESRLSSTLARLHNVRSSLSLHLKWTHNFPLHAAWSELWHFFHRLDSTIG